MKMYSAKEVLIDTMHSLGLTIPRIILICVVAFMWGYLK